MNDELFKEKLGSVSVKQLVRTAKERRPGSMGVAEVNGKKKSNSHRLYMNNLYSREYVVFKALDAEPDDIINGETNIFGESDVFENDDK